MAGTGPCFAVLALTALPLPAMGFNSQPHPTPYPIKSKMFRHRLVIKAVQGSGGELRQALSSKTSKGPFRLMKTGTSVELQTASYTLVCPSPSQVPGGRVPSRADDDMVPGSLFSTFGMKEGEIQEDVKVDLISMVHVGDSAYYRDIVRDAEGYDRVLFELIVGTDVVSKDDEGRRKIVERVYPTRDQVWGG
ncbi:unnamed protein product [Choristocarpus tenellus]